MDLMDILLLTLINAGTCLALPKLISMIVVRRSQEASSFFVDYGYKSDKMGITSFPYCTVYALTGSGFCKFSPRFCNQCSPN